MLKRFLILLLLMPMVIAPVQAGLFSRKKEKIDPKARVTQLIAILKSDRNPDHRTHAAEELRNFDPQVYPEIIPALVGALKSDPKSSVRHEAAQSLGRIRPINQSAGEALEQSVAGDSSMRVRLQARSALMQYHWAGYRNGKKTEVPPLGTTREPPLVNGEKLPPVIQTTPTTSGSYFPRLFPTPIGGSTTREPPLAPEVAPMPVPRPLPVPTPRPVEVKPMPLPSGPDLSLSAQTPMAPPPSAMSAGAGPELP